MNLIFEFPLERWTASYTLAVRCSVGSRCQVTPNFRCIRIVDLSSNPDRNDWLGDGVLVWPQIRMGVGETVLMCRI